MRPPPRPAAQKTRPESDPPPARSANEATITGKMGANPNPVSALPTTSATGPPAAIRNAAPRSAQSSPALASAAREIRWRSPGESRRPSRIEPQKTDGKTAHRLRAAAVRVAYVETQPETEDSAPT